MTYKVLSLKWRPQSFEDIIGQPHVSKTLVNSIKYDRIGQAYLFTGPRGVGKTTTARVLAMSLNSGEGPSFDFNPESTFAREIAESRSLDVIEIDGASNRGIEEIRNLREQIKFAPMESKFKIIIIDEVHMLTNQAFNALLRTLEEPPDHGKFIFATTDVHKVPATIISRCQRFDFNRISINDISKRLSFICQKESLKISNEALYLIAKKADGSMRDSLSILEQVISYCGNDFSKDKISEALGVVDIEMFFALTDSILTKNYESMIKTLNLLSQTGVSPSEILIGIRHHLKNILYAGVSSGKLIFDLNIEDKNRYLEESKRWSRLDLLYINQVLIDSSHSIKNSDSPFLLLEMTMLKLIEMENSINLQELISKLEDNGDLQLSSHIEIPDKDLKQPDNSKIDSLIIEQKSEPSSQKKSNIQNSPSKKTASEELKPLPHNQLTLKSVADGWKDIIKKIQEDRPSISAVLEDYNPIRFEQNTLYIKSNTSAAFNEKILNNGKILLEKELNQISKNKVSVEIEVNKDITKKNTQSVGHTKSRNASNDDEIFNKVVDLFDGEILR